MYENQFNTEFKKQLISIIELSSDSSTEIKEILVEKLKLSPHDRINYCQCGYPLGYTRFNGKEDEFSYLEQILNEEVDFRSYKRYIICPKCKMEIREIQE